MTMIYFKNSKGLSAPVAFTPLVSSSALELMDEYVESGSAPDILGELAGLLRALPRSVQRLYQSSGFDKENDLIEDAEQLEKYQSAFVAAHGVCLPGIFKSNTELNPGDSFGHLDPTPQSLGWEDVGRIRDLAKKLKRELDFLRVSVPLSQISKVEKELKKQAKYSIMKNTPESMLSSEAHAIYLVDEKGFINDKGNPVPIGGARLFESSTAAQRTIQSRGLQKAVVVRAKIVIEGVDFDQKALPDDFGDLSVALSHKEARELAESTPSIDEAPASNARPMRL